MLKIYFKSNCSTCRTTLSLVKENTDEVPEIVEYLNEVPSQKEIREILQLLGIKAEGLVRKKEPLYKEKYADRKISNSEWIKILSENPILIERPIVVIDGKAIIARPPEKLFDFTVSLLAIFVIGGFAAYFIPAHRFRLKAAEQHQKESLNVQNGLLYQRIGSAQQMFDTLKEQIQRLDEKKVRVSALTGVGESIANPKRSWLPPRRGSADFADMTPADLLQAAARQEQVLTAFAAADHPFDSIPVCKPVTGTCLIAQRFGRTRDPFTNSQKFHYGIDFAAASGTPVIATAAGVVVTCDYSVFWGKRIVIAHIGGISSVYAHLGTVTVGPGKRVKRGDAIGAIGFSGLSTGPHVHYEIWRGGVAVDPEGYFFPSSGEVAMGR